MDASKEINECRAVVRAREGFSELTKRSPGFTASEDSSQLISLSPPRHRLSARRGAHLILQADRLSNTPVFHLSLQQILKRMVQMQGMPEFPLCYPPTHICGTTLLGFLSCPEASTASRWATRCCGPQCRRGTTASSPPLIHQASGPGSR